MTGPDRERHRSEIEARAHNAAAAFPPRSEVSRYDQLSPEARALLADFDELDLAEILATTQAAMARARELHRKASHGDTCVYCAHGQRLGYDTTWPCDTIRALDEPAPGPAAVVGRHLTPEQAAAVRAADLPPGIRVTRDVVDEAMRQASTAATEQDKTVRVFAALHQSAEQDVTRVIALYEQWVKAGPPPLGTSISRWWDARLVELHNAIRPPADQTKEQ